MPDLPGSSTERFFISHWTISAPGIKRRTSVRSGAPERSSSLLQLIHIPQQWMTFPCSFLLFRAHWQIWKTKYDLDCWSQYLSNNLLNIGCCTHRWGERGRGGSGRSAELLLCDKGSVFHHGRSPQWPRSLSATTPTASNSGERPFEWAPKGHRLSCDGPLCFLLQPPVERVGDPRWRSSQTQTRPQTDSVW